MKRYQIFISSTYDDLKEERISVLESILKLRHIPVGMEQFVASNEEQFNYIKRLIDETDYYVLIVGNRYGSIADDGISYTEKEFDYAVSKQIPVLAFVHNDPDSLSEKKSEKTMAAKKQLKRFRDKIRSNRLVSLFPWNSPDSLSNEVVVALVNAFNDFPRPGWERVTSYNNSELLSQINDLRMENIMLKEQLESNDKSSEISKNIGDFSWDDIFNTVGRSRWEDYESAEIPVKITWRQLLSVFGPLIISEIHIDTSHYYLNHALFGEEEPYFSIPDRDFQIIVTTFLKLGVITLTDKRITLSNEGKNFLFENNVSMDEFIEDIMMHVRSIQSTFSIENREWKKYIKRLTNFDSNPEAINYIGETLVSASVFLSNQHSLSVGDQNYAQELIKEILQEASEDERTDAGFLDPMFNLSKILELVRIFQKGGGQE